MLRRMLISALAHAFVLHGCGGSSETAATGGATTSGTEVPNGATVRAPPSIVVRNAGAEPRRALRYRFTEGQMESLAMRMRMRIQLSNGSAPLPIIAMPEMTGHVTLGPVHVREDGLFDVPYRISSFEMAEGGDLPAQAVEAIRRELRSMEGIEGSQRMDDRGRIVYVFMQVPETAPESARQTLEQMQRSLEQITFALPEEPLGIGAELDVTMQIQGPPVTMTQVLHVRLDEMNGEALTVSTTLEQRADEQPMTGPAGADVQLLSMAGEGASRLEVSLERLVPMGTFEVRVQSVVRASMNGQTATVTTRMQVEGDYAPTR
jgi:hypothetical protein